MVEPIVLEFKIDDIYIDNPLLSKNDLLKYDTEYCYEKVTKEIDKFIKAQLNFPNIKKPIKATLRGEMMPVITVITIGKRILVRRETLF